MPRELNDNLVFNLYFIVSFCISNQTGEPVICIAKYKTPLVMWKLRSRKGEMIKYIVVYPYDI